MRKLIRTDGSSMDLPAGKSMESLRELIGAATIGTVILRHMGEPTQVMLVDDNGYDTETIYHGSNIIEVRPVRARKPVNFEATRLYWANCLPGTTHQIVGDVVVVPDADFADGRDGTKSMLHRWLLAHRERTRTLRDALRAMAEKW